MAEITSLKPIILPDISDEKKAHILGALDKVGMENIEIPLRIKLPSGETVLVPAQIDAFVSLDQKDAKGIHMSRLYVHIQNTLESEELKPSVVKSLLDGFVETHKGLSNNSFFKARFKLPVLRPSLISDHKGWRQYEVLLEGARKGNEYYYTLGAQVVYSSTCPCSAALSRQLNKNHFLDKFKSSSTVKVQEVAQWLNSEESVVATPHAQRSVVNFKVRLKNANSAPDLVELIDLVEAALKTPVQAAVKRADEQEFARLNAQQLMFCEDAGRVVQEQFEKDPRFVDYWAHISHQESLHPHDAVSCISKGVPGGWSAESTHV